MIDKNIEEINSMLNGMTTNDAYRIRIDDIIGEGPDEPKTLKEALAGPFGSYWLASIKREYNSLLENETFENLTKHNYERIKLPFDQVAVDGRWVLRLKRTEEEIIFKSGWVARGFMQREGIDFDDTYAPVSRMVSLRVLLALAAQEGYNVDHLDVVTAFLNPDILHDVWLKLPEEFSELLDERIDKETIVKLRKALYGLKQSARLWWTCIHLFLIELGFLQSAAEENLYVKKNVFILLYVDDILIVHKSSEDAKELKDALAKRFKMSDLGPATKFLGIEILCEKDNGNIHLSQETYI